MPHIQQKQNSPGPQNLQMLEADKNQANPAWLKSLAATGFDNASAALVPPPVQRERGNGKVSPAQVQAAAQAGMKGSAKELPHAQAIQASFGRHDIGGINAHVGGEAAGACNDMQANAYASGNSVAFKDRPSLHTAAHEAAHIVQQRAGVSLSGGVGRAGDHYERHADAVADAVVQGRSAEGLLDQYAGGAKGDAKGADSPVQQMAVQFEGKGEARRAVSRGFNSFANLYRGGTGKGAGLWSKEAVSPNQNVDQVNEKVKSNIGRQHARRAGIVIGNILTGGLMNLPLFAVKSITANLKHKRDKAKSKDRAVDIGSKVVESRESRLLSAVLTIFRTSEITNACLEAQLNEGIVREAILHELGIGGAPYQGDNESGYKYVVSEIRSKVPLIHLTLTKREEEAERQQQNEN